MPQNRVRLLFVLLVGVAVLAAALPVTAAAAAGPPAGLFTDVALEPSSLSADQARHLDALAARPTTDALRLVRVDAPAALAADRLRLDLFPGERVVVDRQRVDTRAAGDATWFGGRRGASAILVVTGGDVTGTVRDGERLWSVRPIGGGLHAVVRIDPAGFPPDHPQGTSSAEMLSMVAAASGDSDRVTDCARVDLIVAYTVDAAAAVANIQGLIQLAVDETNQSYANSGVFHQVRLVYSYGTDYSDSGNMSTDLARFRINGDGYMDEVHALRDANHADVAMLITDAGAYCGIASTIYANQSTAFALTAQNCATGYYSFGHEIGHLHGARHNPQADPTNTPFPYGHGYYYQPGSWRTVMSYNCPGGCTRIPYWSNPDVLFGGVSMGTAATHDNTRVLNQTCGYIASFR